MYTVSLTNHRFLITSQELEVVYDMMSADYLLDMAVRAFFDTTGTVKTEMTMRVIVWNMAKESKRAPHCPGNEDCEFPSWRNARAGPSIR